MIKEPFIWDFYSDQPSVINDKRFKKTVRKKFILDYFKMLFGSILVLPIAMLLMPFFKGKKIPKNSEFYGIGVNLDKGDVQQSLVDELGVKNLIIRIPLWEIEKIDEYVKFAKSFGKKNILINVIQNRRNIENKELLKQNLSLIFSKFENIANEFQIGTAINRIKWGFFAPCEYLDFYKTAYDLRNEKFPYIRLIGPSVIDFEYHHNVATMFNLKTIKFDCVSALLYVDRRGDPDNTQYGIFNLKNKINLLFSLTKTSPKSSDKIYITETNYPLKNTAPYAPTGEKECVSEGEYVKFMLKYHKIARQSGKISRVYWHQLIAPGYGLVDNRNDKIRKMPQFYAYKEMINENIY